MRLLAETVAGIIVFAVVAFLALTIAVAVVTHRDAQHDAKMLADYGIEAQQ